MSFANLIRDRIEVGLKAGDEQTNPLYQTLVELAEGLSSDSVGAAITQGGVRGRYYLTLWPRTLPARRLLMLSFWVSDKEVRIFVDPPLAFAERDQLESWLVEYVSSPALLESLEELRDLVKRPTEAYLRTETADRLSPNDLAVEIAAADQRYLVEQPEGAAVELDVTISSGPGAGSFDQQQEYICMESGGVRIDALKGEQVKDGLLRVGGVKHVLSDLQKEFEEFDRALQEKAAQRRLT